MPLVRCHTVYGGTTLLESSPSERRMLNAIYIPQDDRKAAPGLYTEEQTFVPEAAFYRGVPFLEVASSGELTLNVRPRARYDGPTCLYIGTLHAHFGHFMLSTLSRLWGFHRLSQELPDLRILYLGSFAIETYFEMDYYEKLFGALGIDAGRFIRFEEPTRVRSVIVPAPALVENHCIYRECATLFARMGLKLAADIPASRDERPVYLTKHALTAGVTSVLNENELVDRLAGAGVEILAPETMSLAAQIALLRDRSTISGIMGSQFHVAAFAPPNRYLMISHEMRAWSNQVLLDMACGNNAVYLHPLDDLFFIELEDERFAINMRLRDPRRTADELLRFLDPFSRISTRAAHWEMGEPSVDMRVRSERHIGRNLALGMPATQSSVSEWSLSSELTEDAAGAVSGRLIGSFQFHTAQENYPWWQVDLERRRFLNGVVVYNVDSPSTPRAFGLRIHVSDTGDDWREVFVHDPEEPFGGKSDTPLIWTSRYPLRCRYVRLLVPREECLHLDQVEVFGYDGDELDEMIDSFVREAKA